MLHTRRKSRERSSRVGVMDPLVSRLSTVQALCRWRRNMYNVRQRHSVAARKHMALVVLRVSTCCGRSLASSYPRPLYLTIHLPQVHHLAGQQRLRSDNRTRPWALLKPWRTDTSQSIPTVYTLVFQQNSSAQQGRSKVTLLPVVVVMVEVVEVVVVVVVIVTNVGNTAPGAGDFSFLTQLVELKQPLQKLAQREFAG